MVVVDHFFPKQLASEVLEDSLKYEWEFCRSDNSDDVYWTRYVYGKRLSPDGQSYAGTDSFRDGKVKECWEYVKQKFHPFVQDENLETCYLNGLTHGIEAYQHIDAPKEEKGVTVICYLCHGWNSNWGGETSFFSGEFVKNYGAPVFYENEIVGSVLPKFNRVVVFDGAINHAVRPISKSFKGLRVTLMFKLLGVDKESIFKKCG